MAMKSASQIAEKWKRNLSASTDAIRAGVQGVQVAPTELAARQADRMAQGVQQAVASGKYQRNCRKVSLQDWQQSFLTKGISRISSGAQAGQSHMEEFMSEFMPIMEQASQQARALPKGTIDDALARVRLVIEKAKQFGQRS